MRVLVTGAAGFYGWAMVQRLVNREDVEKVIGLDNFSRKYFENVDAKQLGKNAQKFEVVRKDYSDLDTHVLNGMDLNAVIHFSAFISIDESMLIPFDYFNNNEVGTFKLTQALLKTKNQPALIFASSPEVYGNPHYTPIDELHPLHPRSTYAATKVACEKHCMVLNEWYGYPVVSMRNFNTFGANQNIAGHGAVLPTFISKSLKNQPLKIEGDGTQTRDFLYIDDAIDAYELALDNVQKVKGEIFNIGSGIETRITDLADKIIQRTHSKSKKEFIPKRLGDLMALQADTKKIHTMLGWKQKTPFDSALDTTIEWYQQHM